MLKLLPIALAAVLTAALGLAGLTMLRRRR